MQVVRAALGWWPPASAESVQAFAPVMNTMPGMVELANMLAEEFVVEDGETSGIARARFDAEVANGRVLAGERVPQMSPYDPSDYRYGRSAVARMPDVRRHFPDYTGQWFLS